MLLFANRQQALDAYQSALASHRDAVNSDDQRARDNARQSASIAWDAYVELSPKGLANITSDPGPYHWFKDRSGFGPTVIAVDGSADYAEDGSVISGPIVNPWDGTGRVTEPRPGVGPRLADVIKTTEQSRYTPVPCRTSIILDNAGLDRWTLPMSIRNPELTAITFPEPCILPSKTSRDPGDVWVARQEQYASARFA